MWVIVIVIFLQYSVVWWRREKDSVTGQLVSQQASLSLVIWSRKPSHYSLSVLNFSFSANHSFIWLNSSSSSAQNNDQAWLKSFVQLFCDLTPITLLLCVDDRLDKFLPRGLGSLTDQENAFVNDTRNFL